MKQKKKNQKKKNRNELVEVIKDRWSNLKEEIEKMTEDEIKTGKPHIILDIFKENFDFNKKNRKKNKVWD